MGEQYDDEYDVEDESPADDSKLVKDLRRQLKEKDKRLAEAETENKQYRAERTKATVSDALRAVGGEGAARFAKFYTGDASEDAVKSWILENADTFGISNEPEVDDATAEQVRSANTAPSNAKPIPSGNPEAIMERMRNAKTPQELAEAFEQAKVLRGQ